MTGRRPGSVYCLKPGLTDPPKRVRAAIVAYRSESDVVGTFLAEVTCGKKNNKLPTADLFAHYTHWVAENGYTPLNSRNFVGELRKRLEVRHNGRFGNVAIGVAVL
jgi:putative DNA primase/helicase